MEVSGYRDSSCSQAYPMICFYPIVPCRNVELKVHDSCLFDLRVADPTEKYHT